ncbi:MAG: beta-lactamase hydrolase domain-containing protein [Caulobacterales bacterium]|jgi:protein tyrosine/serine phosphatase
MSTPAVASQRGFDLTTAEGRRRARHDLIWVDHGFLRAAFQNFHWITPEMARCNQPSPEHIARYAAMGIKTVINLRGFNDSGHYWLEREACARHGLVLVDTPISSRDTPSKERLWRAKAIFGSITYPALMHCKSGADRAGVYGVLYKHWHLGQPLEAAIEQLSARYLHAKVGKTGMLDFFFETAIAETKASGKSFDQWIADDYDPAALKARFMSGWWGNLLTEKILRRE